MRRLHSAARQKGAGPAACERGGGAPAISASAGQPISASAKGIASRPMPHIAFTLLNSVCSSDMPPACRSAAV